MPNVMSHNRPVSRHLEWDSNHFDMPVAELTGFDLSDEDVRSELMNSRAAGYGLVYWQTSPGRQIGHLLAEFGGQFVNHRVRFESRLTSDVAGPDVDPRASGPRIELLPGGEASDWLQELAVAAGRHSRFHVDDHLPPQKCRDLFRIWARRSALRELADRLWIAIDGTIPDRPAGFVTASVVDGTGQIGLIAVREELRGRGIGSHLMAEAHAWLRSRDIDTVSVVTQLENQAACRLYTACGYLPGEIRQCVHFHLSATQSIR